MLEFPTAFLTLPTRNGSAARVLRRKVRLVALKELLTFSGEALGPRSQVSIRQMQSVLQRSVKQDPAAVLAAVGSPDVMVPLLAMAAGLRSPSDVAPGMVVALFAALAAEAVPLEQALVWEESVGTLPLPREGTLVFEPPAKALLVDPAGLAVELASGQRVNVHGLDGVDVAGVRVGHRFVPIGPSHLDVHLSLHDSNPLALEEAHPDKDGNAVTLGEKPLDVWRMALNEALELIRLGLPEWYEELRDTTVRVLPVGYEPEMHLSASYREAPGVVYLTLHPDPLTMAEALVHETQHGKLNLLTWLDPVLNNAYTSWSASPVRPDLRPIMGVFLAVHAFVPVAALHAQLAASNHAVAQTRRFEERRAEVMAGNAGGLAVVQNTADPTAMGAKVLVGLQTVHDFLTNLVDSSDWSDDALPLG